MTRLVDGSPASQDYLFAHDFRIVSGIPDAEKEAPDFAGDFEQWFLMSGNAASDRVDVSFPGQLGNGQTTIASINIPIRGTGASSEYRLKVFVEGQGATPVFDSTLTAAPGSRTVVTVLKGALSDQPTGEKRFYVVVEAHIDSGETLRVGRPLVAQE